MREAGDRAAAAAGPALLVGCLLAACGAPERTVPLELLDPGRLSADALEALPRRLGDCRPARLGRDDTLTLRMSTPHPGELALIRPDGTWMYVVHAFENFGPSLMPPDEFAGRGRLALPAGEARALPFVVGRDTLERIFREPGRFDVRVVRRLSTDADQPVYGCTVELLPRR